MKSPSSFRSVAFAAALVVLPCLVEAQKTDRTGFESETYKKIGDIELKMRIYKPDGWAADDSRPAVVFFFGGGWRGGSPDQFHPHCEDLAKRGMVAMAAEYRIKNLHDSTPTQSTMDAKSAMRWIRANAGKLGIDPDRLAAGGGSAGGHLAAATATIGDAINEESDDLSVSAVPNALILFNPAVNLLLPKIRDNFGEELYASFAAISPYQHVTAELPPAIIFHGTADDAVPFETVEKFTDKANELGAKVELVAYEDRPHGFFNFGRGDGNDYEDSVERMDAFLVDLGWIDAK